MAPNTTFPVPAGIRLMSSFDLVPSMLFPLILSAGNCTAPEPDGLKMMSSLVRVALISLPVTCIVVRSNPADPYTSVKLSFTLIIAARKVSPVPSFAASPTFKTNLDIFYTFINLLTTVTSCVLLVLIVPLSLTLSPLTSAVNVTRSLSAVLVRPNVDTYASVPSCVTLASMVSNLPSVPELGSETEML